MKHLLKLIAILFFTSILTSCSNTMTIDKALMKAASEINESCPIMIDQDTRLDNAISLPNNVFQYNYTLVNFTKEELDIEELTEYLTPQLTNNVKTNPDLKSFRDNGVNMKYYYKDRNGEFVLQISITQDDYK